MNNSSAGVRAAKAVSNRAKSKTSAKAAWLEASDSARIVDIWEFDGEELLDESDEFRILDECSDPALRMMLGLPLH